MLMFPGGGRYIYFLHVSYFFQDLVEGEETYTVEKLWGLGPIKKEPQVEKPDDVVNFERYKVGLMN